MNPFYVVGTLELIVAGILAVIGALARGDAMVPLLGTAAVFAISGYVFRRVGSRLGRLTSLSPKLLETGERGTALVVELAETGVTINNDPVFGYTLDVAIPGRDGYRTTVKQRTPRMLMGAILPGMKVTVAADPARPDRVAIDWSGPMDRGGPSQPPTQADLAAAVSSAPRRSIEEQLRTGKRARARLVSMQDIGDISDLGLASDSDEGADDRMFLITLEVKQPGLDPRPVSVAHRVPEHLVGRVGPGAEVEVAIDRDDPNDVAIDWAAYEASGGV